MLAAHEPSERSVWNISSEDVSAIGSVREDQVVTPGWGGGRQQQMQPRIGGRDGAWIEQLVEVRGRVGWWAFQVLRRERIIM